MSEEQIKKGYKVLRKKKEILLSATNMGSVTEYSLTDKTYPPEQCGPLCVFDNVKDAETLAYHTLFPTFGPYCIYSCTYHSSPKSIIWYMSKGMGYSTDSKKLPQGTQLAEWIQLEKEEVTTP